MGVALLVAACGGGSGSAPGPRPPPCRTCRRQTASSRLTPAWSGPEGRHFGRRCAARRRSCALSTTVRLGPLAASSCDRCRGRPRPGEQAMRQHIGLARDLATTATAPGLQGQLQWLPTGAARSMRPSASRRRVRWACAWGCWCARCRRAARCAFMRRPARRWSRCRATRCCAPWRATCRRATPAMRRALTGAPISVVPTPRWSWALPAHADLAQLDIAVPTLSHFFVPPESAAQPGLSAVGAAGSCNVDLSCRPDVGSESRSVARMLFVENGRTFLCTGTLLNDAQSSATPIS